MGEEKGGATSQKVTPAYGAQRSTTLGRTLSLMSNTAPPLVAYLVPTGRSSLATHWVVQKQKGISSPSVVVLYSRPLTPKSYKSYKVHRNELPDQGVDLPD